MTIPTKLEAAAFQSAIALRQALQQAYDDMVAAWPRGAELEWRDHDGTIRRGAVLAHAGPTTGGRLRVRNIQTLRDRTVYIYQIHQAVAGVK